MTFSCFIQSYHDERFSMITLNFVLVVSILSHFSRQLLSVSCSLFFSFNNFSHFRTYAVVTYLLASQAFLAALCSQKMLILAKCVGLDFLPKLGQCSFLLT